MMRTNAEIMRVNLSNLMNNIKGKLQANGFSLYENELDNLTEAIHVKLPQRKGLFEKNEQHYLAKLIMDIMEKIDHDIAGVETEMHGVANYSQYESNRIEEAAVKQQIKDDLSTMLDLVLSTRLEKRAMPKP